MDKNIKDFLDKVKVTASQAAEAAGKVADAAGKKASELMDNTKLNVKIYDLNGEIDLLLKEIGRSVYLTHTGVEVDTDEIDMKLELIDQKYADIQAIKNELAGKKPCVKCPNCGKDCNKTDIFCSACGFELKQQ